MSDNMQGVAIIGMSGRFPGAGDVATFWENIKRGVDAITRFPREELEIAPPEDDGDYVCAKGLLDDIDMFDARFFGYLPKEAEVMDPQHRVFLEICWEAMEAAGYDAARYEGAVGVFGGCYMDTYVLHNLCSDEAFRQKLIESIQVGTLQTELGNDKDYFATRVAFKMGLKGPAMTLQTACSTSLVAIATACQSIESYQSDMALAGGVTIVLPQKKGYFYKEGSMLSPDGRCRPFDEKAAGTVFSNGAAVVLLKRAEDAIRDGDTIYGIIRGYATNNDGGEKLSYTAPSVDGQAEVIALAQGMGGINARSIGYVEAHGTATPLGDPIEVAGLTKAFGAATDDKQFCALGSVKANLGHLDCASGAIGLIKTALALHEKTLPPLLHFEKPNPKIDFTETPFFINTELKPWESEGPRRAGVSSFGVGGTNAHVVVEEAPAFEIDPARRSHELLLFSARSETALDAQANRLADFLETNPDTDLADAAHTLRVGRREFEHRRVVVAADESDAIEKLRTPARPGETAKQTGAAPEIIFMFPGQGAQYPGMGRGLYESEPVYRETIDRIADALLASEDYGRDVRDFLLWTEEAGAPRDEVAAALAQTANAQPALFAVECALAALLDHWGVKPAGVIGHSIGEFAGAVSAGVLALEDATRLVAARGALMQAQPAGRMLAVMMDADAVRERLPENLSIAAVNAPGATVVSGAEQAVARFAAALERDGVASTALKTSHAFHSPLMAGAQAPLTERAAAVATKPADVAVYSTMTGGRAGADVFADPAYWGEQLMRPVLFEDALQAAAEAEAPRLFVEIGPGQTLCGFARRALGSGGAALPALRPVNDPGDDVAHILGLAGRLWLHGVRPDWARFAVGRRRRVPLPTYPFERKRCWIEPAAAPAQTGTNVAAGRGDVKITNPQGGEGAVGDLIDQQLDVIAAQLAILKGR